MKFARLLLICETAYLIAADPIRFFKRWSYLFNIMLIILRNLVVVLNLPYFVALNFVRLPFYILDQKASSKMIFHTHHLFLGHSEIVRDIVPLMHDTTALYQVYMRFLQTIEQETELRTQRIVTAHVLYEISPLYKNALHSRQYSLSDDGEMLRGILCDLFMQDNFEVFCMYVDQNVANDSGLQLLLPGIPHNTVGTILCLACANPHATSYLQKLLSRQSYGILPHIENLNLGLYQINGKSIKRTNANSYRIESNLRKETITVPDMSQHIEINLLRFSLNMYTLHFNTGTNPQLVDHLPELFCMLASHTSPELLIKETMKFFENSFVTTSYGTPFQRSVHPEVTIADNLADLMCDLKPTIKVDESFQFIKLIISIVVDHDGQKPFADVARRIAQQLLTQCLHVFNTCSLEEQTLIIRNLSQLSLAALKIQKYKECLYLTRALMFCCLSAPEPTIEFHDALLRSIFLFCSARVEPAQQKLLTCFKDIAVIYVQGLPQQDQVALAMKNPALMRRIMRETHASTIFRSIPTSSPAEIKSNASPQIML